MKLNYTYSHIWCEKSIHKKQGASIAVLITESRLYHFSNLPSDLLDSGASEIPTHQTQIQVATPLHLYRAPEGVGSASKKKTNKH